MQGARKCEEKALPCEMKCLAVCHIIWLILRWVILRKPHFGISQLAGSRHITWTKPWPEPKAWASFGFWGPKAQAWILLGPTQAKLSLHITSTYFSWLIVALQPMCIWMFQGFSVFTPSPPHYIQQDKDWNVRVHNYCHWSRNSHKPWPI